MWLIGGVLVGSSGSLRSCEDEGCIENSVLYDGRERRGDCLGNSSVHDIQQSRHEGSKSATSE